MRSIVLASALLAGLTISATAHATPVSKTTYFHLAMDGHPTVSFSLDPSILADCSLNACYINPGYWFEFDIVPFSSGRFGQVAFFNAAVYPNSFDFAMEDNSYDYPDGLEAGGTGPKLYSGSETDPTFIPGKYDVFGLWSDGDKLEVNVPLHLTISQTPEPSSLVLFGTGALACLGSIRRRFAKA